MRILITFGAVSVPIDGMRRIANQSSGSTGQFLALHLAGIEDCEVHCLVGETDREPFLGSASSNLNCERASSYPEFSRRLEELLAAFYFDWVVQLAAVPDFIIDSIENEEGLRLEFGEGVKLDSSSPVTIKTRRSQKLIQQLKKWSKNKSIHVIGFKYTPEFDLAKTLKVLGSGGADFVVSNWQSGIGCDRHEFKIYSESSRVGRDKPLAQGSSKQEMAMEIAGIICS